MAKYHPDTLLKTASKIVGSNILEKRINTIKTKIIFLKFFKTFNSTAMSTITSLIAKHHINFKIYFFISFFSSLFLGTSLLSQAQTNIVAWTFEGDNPNAFIGLPVNMGTLCWANSGQVFTSSVGISQELIANQWTASNNNQRFYTQAFSTVGYQDITISFQHRTFNWAPRDFALEYSLNNINWVNVQNYSVQWFPNNFALPAALNDQPTVYIRWRKRSSAVVGGGLMIGGSRLDNVYIRGNEFPQTPTDILLNGSGTTTTAPAGTVIGTFSTVDGNANDTHTYTLVSGAGDANNALFSINGDELVQNGMMAVGSYSIRVRTTDSANLTYEEVFTITVITLPAGTLQTETFEDESNAATTFGFDCYTFTTTEDLFVDFTSNYGCCTSDYYISSGVGNGGTPNVAGQIQLGSTDGFVAMEMDVWTSPSDGNNYASGNVTFTGYLVAGGTVSATMFISPTGDDGDDHQHITFLGTPLGGAIISALEVDLSPSSLNYIQIDNLEYIGIETCVPFAPTDIALTNNTTTDINPANTVIGTFSATDPNYGDTHTFALVSGTGDTDNASFTITGNQLSQNAVLAGGSYSIRVQATDGTSLTFEKIFTITVVELPAGDLVTETFEDEPNTATTFSHGGYSFVSTGDFSVEQYTNFGCCTSSFYLQTGWFDGSSSGVVGQIQMTTPDKVFVVQELDMWTSNNDGFSHFTGDVLFRGYLSGGGTIEHTVTIAPTATSGNGYDHVDFSTSPFVTALLTALEMVIPASSPVDYMIIDNFKFIGTDACTQPDVPTVSNDATICPSSSVTLSVTGGDQNDATDWYWYTGSCGGTAAGTGSSITVNPSTSTTYYVRGEGGCATASTCASVAITASDTQSPVISLTGANPQVIQCGSSYSELGASATDNCAVSANVSINAAAVNTSSVGSYTVTYNVSDDAGNAATQVTRTVNVVDSTLPVISLTGANPQVIECGGSYTELGATASDNCGVSASVTINSTSVNASSTGSYTVTYNVSDDAGNAATQVTRTVNVVDSTIPVISLTGANPQIIECGGSYTELGATASDNCGVSASVSINSTSVNASSTGSYTVTYNVSDDAGNAATQVTRTVNVVDSTLPVISLTGANPQVIECGGTYTELGATASDNCGVSASVSINSTSVNASSTGSYTVTYNVSDDAGNAATQVTRTVNVVDSTIPVISLTGANPQTIECGSSYTELGATVTDNCGVSASVTINAMSVNASSTGSYTVTYNVSDDAGNAAVQVTRTVNVVDTTVPTISCITNQVRSAASGVTTYTTSGTEFDPSTTDDNCGIASVAYTLTGATTGSGTNTLNGVVFNSGATTVQWTITDGNSLTANCSFTVTISDTQAPVITSCPLDRNIVVAVGAANGVVPDMTAEVMATDNGTIVSIAQSPASGTSFGSADGDTQTVTFTATDDAGLQSTCTATLTLIKAVLWTGGTDTNWATPTNWDSGSIPTSADHVGIPDVSGTSGNFPTLGTANTQIKSLNVLSGATLTINTGGQLFGNTTANDGVTIQTNAHLILAQGAMLSFLATADNGLIVKGTLTNNGGQASFQNSPGIGILNYGTIQVNSGTVDSNNPAGTFGVRNYGTINVSPCSSFGTTHTFQNESSGILTSQGTLGLTSAGANINNGTLTTSQLFITLQPAPYFTGTGTLNNTGSVTDGASTLWTGCGGDTNWHNNFNWHNYQVPTMTKDVTIPDISPQTNYPQVSTPMNMIQSIVVENGATLTVQSGGQLVANHPTGDAITIATGGTIDLDGGSTLMAAGASGNGAVIDGTLNNSGGQLFVQDIMGIGILNRGTINNTAGFAFDNSTTSTISFHNEGIIHNHTCAGMGGQKNLVNTATGNITNDGNMLFFSPTSSSINDGTLTNNSILILLQPTLTGSGTFIDNGTLIDSPTTYVWTGCAGNTDWNNSSNWSTFGVPNSTIDVELLDLSPATNYPIINNSGNVAKSITIHSGASLDIQSSGELTIDGSTTTGLDNQGMVSNSGILTIQNTTGSSITNTGTFTNQGNCSKLIIDNSIMNTSGTLTNQGLLKTTCPTSNQNDNMVSNTGRIYNTTGVNPFFTGTGTFNETGVTINTLSSLVWSGCAGAGDTDWNKAANWDYYEAPTAGKDVQIIDISPATNYPIITSTGNVARSLTVGSNVTFSIENGGDLTLNGSSTQGVQNQGTISNAGVLKIQNAPVSIQNTDQLTNEACGVLELDSQLDNTGTGTFLNEGRLITAYSGTNINAGSLTNNRIIADANGAFTGVSITSGPMSQVTNDASVTYGQESIAATVSVCNTGTVMDFINNPGTYEEYFITDLDGNPLGTYYNSTNTFDPYSTTPVGTHTAQVRSQIPPFTACYQPILTFNLEVNSCKTESLVDGATTPISESDWSLSAYPNPFSDISRVVFEAVESTDLVVSLYSMTGQRVGILYEGEVVAGEQYETQVEAGDLPSGMYIIHLQTASGKTEHLKVILQSH